MPSLLNASKRVWEQIQQEKAWHTFEHLVPVRLLTCAPQSGLADAGTGKGVDFSNNSFLTGINKINSTKNEIAEFSMTEISSLEVRGIESWQIYKRIPYLKISVISRNPLQYQCLETLSSTSRL